MLPTFAPPPGIRVVYSDLDGTMLGRAGSFLHGPGGQPTTDPAAALIAAFHAGIEVVPVSGRAMPGIARDARILGMRTAIGEMGAVTSYDLEREVVTNLGEYPLAGEPPVSAMDRLGIVSMLTAKLSLEPHAPWHLQRELTYLLRGNASVGDANVILADAGFGWLELVDNGMLHGAYLGMPPGTSRAYHLLPVGVSKRAAVDADRKRRNITRDETLAIGDSHADLAMAPAVAMVVLMADAVAADPSLGAAAAPVPNAVLSPRPGSLGWADVIAALAGTTSAL